MFFLARAKVTKWMFSLIATIPEKYIWEFIDTVMDKLVMRIDSYPKWVRVTYRLLDHILQAVHPDSAGGYMITRGELIDLVQRIWDELEEPQL